MRIRIRFSKGGSAKYIGHLDVMRYFQKAVRRAGLPAVYSGGFHPHMLMSFASPLGVGQTSRSEYFDIDMEEGPTSAEIVEKLNAQMAPAFRVLDAVRVPEEKGNKGMHLTAAAIYAVTLADPDDARIERLAAAVPELTRRKSFEVEKQTKKGSRIVDIRPHIYELTFARGVFTMTLAADSANYLKPDAVLGALALLADTEIKKNDLRIERVSILADTGKKGRKFVPLHELGEIIG